MLGNKISNQETAHIIPLLKTRVSTPVSGYYENAFSARLCQKKTITRGINTLTQAARPLFINTNPYFSAIFLTSWGFYKKLYLRSYTFSSTA
ncbi:MAG: hypothetical protein ACSLEL_05110 [Candidatus Malihini olakiniferum]